MECQIEQQDKTSIIHLSGEIDLYCSADARKAILSELGHLKSVLVELSAVKYIDSSAVASLVEGYQMAKYSGLNFSLVSVSDEAMQVLKLARLDKVFSFYDSVDEAIKG